jgi:hypothetical protein
MFSFCFGTNGLLQRRPVIELLFDECQQHQGAVEPLRPRVARNQTATLRLKTALSVTTNLPDYFVPLARNSDWRV